MKKETIFISALFFALILTITLVSADTLTITPDNKGAYSSWLAKGCRSGSLEWKCVSEAPAKTVDNLYAASKNVYESFSFKDTGLTNQIINKVTLYYYGQRYSTTRYKFQPFIRAKPAGSKKAVDYIGSVKSLTADYTYYSEVYNNNPSTGKPWLVSEVNALEAGMKTYTSNYGGRIAQVYAVIDYTVPNPDSCSDTDNGNKINIFGSVSGYLNQVFYNLPDSCIDNSTILEYFCNGVSKTSQQQTCGADGYNGESYCMSDKIYRNYTDYSCTNGACSSAKTIILQKECSGGQHCVDAQCLAQDTCSDTDEGNKPLIFGNTSGYLNQEYYSYTDSCMDNITLLEYFCLGTHSITSVSFCNLTGICSEGKCI